MMNGVMVLDAEADPGRVAEMLAEVAASGLPHNVQLRPSIGPELIGVAESAGLTLHHETPLMALQRAAVAPALAVSVLGLREIEPAEAELHARIGAEAFGIPTELLAHVSGPSVLSLPEVSCYVGELDGVAVATCLAILIDQHLAIFNVATLEDHRRRGHGAAITARAVQDGFARGAHTAWLQSSPIGVGVYETLGFSLVERWRCWISPAS
jgi:ribosomal protein S18 acetylase RimI-like enzyme